MSQEPVILIDLSNLFFRCHFAFQNLSSEGRPTGVLYGVLKTIADLRELVSKRLYFVWDHGIPIPGAAKPRNWRDGFLPTYKATRKHDDGERARVFSQLPDLAQLIQWLGYGSISVMGLEADDVIGILAGTLPDNVLIYSTDKDFYQLLKEWSNRYIRVLVPQKDKGAFKQISCMDVEEEYTIPTFRWAEFLALGGDSSDNIKPMRGMGPKTAIKLIQSGVDLRQEYGNQPLAFRSKYASVWNEIQNAYSAARIPTSASDPRIRSYVPKGIIIPSSAQTWKDEEERRKCQCYFEKFVADREMTTILSLRRQLFDTK